MPECSPDASPLEARLDEHCPDFRAVVGSSQVKEAVQPAVSAFRYRLRRLVVDGLVRAQEGLVVAIRGL